MRKTLNVEVLIDFCNKDRQTVEKVAQIEENSIAAKHPVGCQ